MTNIYNGTDQYQIIGLNSHHSWVSSNVVAITPSCRTATITVELRSSIIASEARSSTIATENRNTSITC